MYVKLIATINNGSNGFYPFATCRKALRLLQVSWIRSWLFFIINIIFVIVIIIIFIGVLGLFSICGTFRLFSEAK